MKVALAFTIALIGFLCLLSGLGTIAYQAMLWLQDGIWTPYKTSGLWFWLGGGRPNMPELRGVQKIIEAFLDLPLGLGLALTGAVAMMVGDHLVKPPRKTRPS